MKRITEDDLVPLRDRFIDRQGNVAAVVADIDDDAVFPIGAGPWPSEFSEAIRVRCAACTEFAGISPKGLEIHRRNPMRAIFRPSCLVMLHNMMVARGGPTDAK